MFNATDDDADFEVETIFLTVQLIYLERLVILYIDFYFKLGRVWLQGSGRK